MVLLGRRQRPPARHRRGEDHQEVQAAKARARGYRTTENFITIAYLVCGKLNFNLPT